jgi:hypothetical protein
MRAISASPSTGTSDCGSTSPSHFDQRLLRSRRARPRPLPRLRSGACGLHRAGSLCCSRPRGPDGRSATGTGSCLGRRVHLRRSPVAWTGGSRRWRNTVPGPQPRRETRWAGWQPLPALLRTRPDRSRVRGPVLLLGERRWGNSSCSTRLRVPQGAKLHPRRVGRRSSEWRWRPSPASPDLPAGLLRALRPMARIKAEQRGGRARSDRASTGWRERGQRPGRRTERRAARTSGARRGISCSQARRFSGRRRAHAIGDRGSLRRRRTPGTAGR